MTISAKENRPDVRREDTVVNDVQIYQEVQMHESPSQRPSPIQDFATSDGTYILEQTTVGEYLKRLNLYDPNTHNANWDVSIVSSDFQRAILPIEKNPIKRRMLRDLMRGGTLPPIVLYVREGQRPQIVDGLQRTHVETEALKALIALEAGESPKEAFAREELEAMKELGQSPLSVENFLQRPALLQQWYDLQAAELVRLFMILNVGQQKVSPRHLLEVMGRDLRRMFEEWGLRLLTEREEKEQPRRRRPRKDNAGDGVAFRYEYLLDGLYAYISRNPLVKTSKILQDEAETSTLALDQRVTEIGSELCSADFVWVCRDLNAVILERYKDHPRWRIAVQQMDTFFIPLMAALGDARHNPRSRGALEDRKKKLIDVVRASKEADPLILYADDTDSLNSILDNIKSNIGRKQRTVVFTAWRRYFILGSEDPACPIDWRVALLSE